MKQAPDTDVVIPEARRGSSVLPTLYAGAVIVAGLYYGRELMIPLVMAALLAFVLAPPCAMLQKLWFPRVLAVLVVVLLAFAAIGGLGVVVGRQAASLAASLPTYKTTIDAKWDAIVKRYEEIESLGQSMGGVPKPGGATAGGKPTTPVAKPGSPVESAISALGLGDASGLSLARSVALPFLSPLATGGVVLLFTFFILLSNEDLRDRLVRLVGRQDLHRTILAMNDAASRLSRYFLFQLAINATFGLIIGVSLGLAGLPSPLLWGILALLLRFIPFVGPVLAAAPPLLLAVAIVPGWSLALFVLVLFVVAESIMGQVVEPLIYGHNTGLSPIAVIVATAFWALLWGPIGLLIATPLTVCIVVIGRHVEALSFFDVILGDTPPLEAHETFYQRALERRGATLLPGARRRIGETSLTDYYDKVALPGLALAQGDLARDGLAFERLETIHGEIEKLLAGLATGDAGVASVANPPPVAWARDGAIVCIPARGQLDDLAGMMAVQALDRAGFGARAEPNLVVGSNDAAQGELANVRLCCLSILEHGSTVSAIRYFMKRLRKQMPDAAIVVGLWHADRDSAMLAALREGTDEHLVLSIGELLAFCRALAARTSVQPDPSPKPVVV